MKKIIVLISSLFIIFGILYYSINNLINSDVVLYENISTESLKEMINEKQTFILYLYQKNCMSCKQVKPIINEYIRKSNKSIFAIDINYDENKNYILQDLNVQGTPTLIFYNQGKETSRFNSIFTEKEFSEKLEEFNYIERNFYNE